MRLQITHLSAPWPEGAVVGDVVELPSIPAWAVGKCEPLPEQKVFESTGGGYVPTQYAGVSADTTRPTPEAIAAAEEAIISKPRRGRPPKAKE